MQNNRLIDRVGGQQKLQLIIAKFYQYVLADDDDNIFYLKYSDDIAKLHRTVTKFFISEFGGANHYQGPDIFTLHKKMGIEQKNFTKFWFYLCQSLRQHNVPQNVIQEIKLIVFGKKQYIVKTLSN